MTVGHWGRLVRERRTELGLTLNALSKRSGVPVSTIKSVEELTSNPYVVTLEKILNALRFDLEVVDADFGSPNPMGIVTRGDGLVY